MTERAHRSARDVLLAALPGHSAEDATTVDYLLLTLRDAGYLIVHPDGSESLPNADNSAEREGS